MNEKDRHMRDAGQELASFAHSLPEEDVRSRTELLFPYVFEASKKMSVRAISDWLETEKGIKFSAPSVSKVLRNQERHFRQIAERIQPIAEQLSNVLGLDVGDLLFQSSSVLDSEPVIAYASAAHAEVALRQVDASRDRLKREWHSLSTDVKLRAFQHFEFEKEDDDEDSE
jgi:hypothetical protein